MKYIEIIVLINVVIHTIFVKTSGYVLGLKINKFLIICSNILDSIYVVLYLLFPYQLEKYKYICVLIISYLPFSNINAGKFTGFVIYLLYNLSFGGVSEILYQIHNLSLFYIMIILFIFYIISIIWRFNVKVFNFNCLYYDVRITIENKKYNLTAYLDTGNLLEYDFIPIVLVKNKEILIKPYKNITIDGALNEGKIMIYKVDKFEVKIKNKYVKKDVYIGFADTSFDALLGLRTIGG